MATHIRDESKFPSNTHKNYKKNLILSMYVTATQNQPVLRSRKKQFVLGHFWHHCDLEVRPRSLKLSGCIKLDINLMQSLKAAVEKNSNRKVFATEMTPIIT